jgi:hypothetical protein
LRNSASLFVSFLKEQLDGAGIELPKLYEMIESQAPNGCYTEAWKQRAHWVGTQVTKETVESLANAERFLHTHRPVRKRHGKLLEEGASGFLEKKLADGAVKESLAGTSELDWSSLNKVFSEKRDESVSFGSKQWASVYLASTPHQAAAMGLEFPGVNEVIFSIMPLYFLTVLMLMMICICLHLLIFVAPRKKALNVTSPFLDRLLAVRHLKKACVIFPFCLFLFASC